MFRPRRPIFLRDEHAVIGQVTKVKLSDRIKRLELIGKHVDVQAFAERAEIGGIGGGPMQVEDMILMEQARRIAWAMAKAANANRASHKCETELHNSVPRDRDSCFRYSRPCSPRP